MEIYIFVEILLLFLTIISNKKNRKVILYASVLLLFIILALHDGQEFTDFPNYIEFFQGKDGYYGSLTKRNGYNLELPYLYYCKFLRLFGTNAFVYILGYALTVFIPFYFLVKKYSSCPSVSVFFLFTLMAGQLYLFYSAVHRQMLASVFIIIVFFILHSKLKYRKTVIVILICLSCVSHSSTFFILPLLIYAFYNNKTYTVRNYIVYIIISMFIGLIFSANLNNIYYVMMDLLRNVDLLSRATVYTKAGNFIISDNTTLYTLLPISLTSIGIVFFTNKKERNTFFVKCLVLGTCTYNIFSTLPLINRTLTLVFLFAISGAIPSKILTDKKCKFVFIVIMSLNLFMAYRWYISPDFRLDFHFIWE